ncbi:MAG: imidazole glycerol phosphate synthase subunit HisH [Candidatus Omnitrophica bacterium]|nr:imidazole glycerol phosphate synthase subunit HisH [Candidatus Omnitrophota bacterium]
MSETKPTRVAIVDYGMGNLFSVQQACAQAGLAAAVTAEPQTVLETDAVILPGVGAFGDAMAELTRRDLVVPLRDAVASGKPLLGICLGMQLLMSESHEFGRHRGLNIIEGEVVRLPVSAEEPPRRVKVPEVGWNPVWPVREDAWVGSLLEGIPAGACMYFVHSYYVRPVDATLILSTTTYGPITYCSSLQFGNVFGCQFHPERSGPAGLKIYRNLATRLGRLYAEVERS